jgi:oligopeptide/dipeptide ABC transporter ATP-binding protein
MSGVRSNRSISSSDKNFGSGTRRTHAGIIHACLLGSLPRPNATQVRLATIEGTVPNLAAPPPGCRFAPRCPFADGRCRETTPPLIDISPTHRVACWKAPVEAAA